MSFPAKNIMYYIDKTTINLPVAKMKPNKIDKTFFKFAIMCYLLLSLFFYLVLVRSK